MNAGHPESKKRPEENKGKTLQPRLANHTPCGILPELLTARFLAGLLHYIPPQMRKGMGLARH